MQIVRSMEAATRDETPAKLLLYSGHDTTIMPLLVALQIPLETWPPYVSNVVFELWRQPDGRHFVRFAMEKFLIAFLGLP